MTAALTTPARQEATGLALTARQLRAASLLADGALTDTQIAAEMHINRCTLIRWKRLPAMQEAVASIRQKLRAEIVYERITDARYRIRLMQDVLERHIRLLDARAADPDLADVPGGDTGLLVKTLKVIGTGDSQQVIEEYRRDEIPRDIIAILEHVRKETGEDRQRLEVTGRDGGPIELAAVDLRERMLAEVEQAALRLLPNAAEQA